MLISIPDAAGALPVCRRGLVLRQTADDGRHVVKDPASGQYFQLGPEESFLLLGLNGRHTSQTLCAAFERRFGDSLDADGLQEFIDQARASGLLQGPGEPAQRGDSTAETSHADSQPASQKHGRQSILYWRRRIFDPDRLFDWMEPRLGFLWTPGFLILSGAMILAAGILVIANGRELALRLPGAWRWETLLLAWLALAVATTCHEFAHGLTCKHFGGEVHEIGFLLIYFTPCFYCNVSDAWLFPRRSRRLWVTFAGGYCDLLLWAVAVFVWRTTLQDTALNFFAWVVLSVCGARIFFNLNPLLKLDGYYLLSDWLEIPNLRQQAWDRMMAHVRWLLWGSPRPQPEPRGRFLLTFGVISWCYSLFFLLIMLYAFSRMFAARWGGAGLAAASGLALVSLKGMSEGICQGEARKMLTKRPRRLTYWTGAVGVALVALCLVPVEREPAGSFQVRPASRAEVRSPTSGFVREVRTDEAEAIRAGQVIAVLEIPDLATRTAQKESEIDARCAKLAACRAEWAFAKADCARAATLSPAQRLAADKAARVWGDEVDNEAAEIRHAREELDYLHSLAEKCVVRSGISGVIVTPHLKERLGQFLKEGDLICEAQNPSTLLAEVKLAEQEVEHVRAGQTVRLRARALPFDAISGIVERVAPAAAPGDLQSTVTVYCRLTAAPPGLRAGMTGYARIQAGSRPLGQALAASILRFLRTEFWL